METPLALELPAGTVLLLPSTLSREEGGPGMGHFSAFDEYKNKMHYFQACLELFQSLKLQCEKNLIKVLILSYYKASQNNGSTRNPIC